MTADADTLAGVLFIAAILGVGLVLWLEAHRR